MRARRGAILLEAIVAVTILAIAGLAGVAFVSDASASVQRARTRDRAVRDASAFMDAVSLWPRADLDRHLGSRPQGVWRLTVNRPTPTLYVLLIADSTGTDELLRTTVFRRLDSDVTR